MADRPGAVNRSAACSCCCFLALAAVIAGLVCLFVFTGKSKDGTYSVTVTGVSGLDPAADLSAARPTLSPVFNLTVHIDNSRDYFSKACVGRFSTAAVSYGDAFLAQGSVPQFCAGTRKRERGVRAWGDGVALPRFLRDQMAGELAVGEVAVDVKVTMPDDCYYQCTDTLLICSKARIGGGPAPCRKEIAAYHHDHHEN